MPPWNLHGRLHSMENASGQNQNKITTSATNPLRRIAQVTRVARLHATRLQLHERLLRSGLLRTAPASTPPMISASPFRIQMSGSLAKKNQRLTELRD